MTASEILKKNGYRRSSGWTCSDCKWHVWCGSFFGDRIHCRNPAHAKRDSSPPVVSTKNVCDRFGPSPSACAIVGDKRPSPYNGANGEW